MGGAGGGEGVGGGATPVVDRVARASEATPGAVSAE